MEYDSLLFEGDLRRLITSEIRYGDLPNILDVLGTVEDVVVGILDDEPTKQEFLERYQSYDFDALLENQTKHMDLEDYAEVFTEYFSVCNGYVGSYPNAVTIGELAEAAVWDAYRHALAQIEASIVGVVESAWPFEETDCREILMHWLGSTDPEKWEDEQLVNFAKKHFEIRKDQTPVQVGRDVAEALEWDL